jgi:aspartyl-tRNA(Asn)/glutamyl-tRNA(Gln) amidotransferase subunit B
MSDYLPTIGIETHVQLKTKTKLFAAVDNDARSAKPNTLISHICVGMPGALPVLNQGAVELAAKAAYALNSQPQAFSKFDRKHYFYPDLPKGYQISQFEQPIVLGGYVEINVHGETKKIGIVRAHLEEDAGKNTHPDGADYSLVDLNRAGTPLLEIVSEPQLHSSAEAKAYARELYLLMKYSEVSDVDMYHGNLRFDVNISLSKDPGKLGTRAEVKNLNSFRSVEAAIEYEIKRQAEILDVGGKIVQETRGWDEAHLKTTSQRGKEEAHDYRYMPEPDVPPIEFTEVQINDFKKDLPVLPAEIRTKLSGLGIDEANIETLIDHSTAGLFVYNSADKLSQTSLKRIANWLIGDVQAFITAKNTSWDEIKLDAVSLGGLAQMVEDAKLNSNAAKEVLLDLINNGGDPEDIASSKNLLQVSDEGELEEIVAQVLAENEKAATDVANGEMKAIGFLVGQVMAKSQGKANPGVAQQIIKKQLGL